MMPASIVFPEADFVRKQIADDGIVQHAVRNLGLMLEDFDFRRNERGQTVRELILPQQFTEQSARCWKKERRLLREFREHHRRNHRRGDMNGLGTHPRASR